MQREGCQVLHHRLRGCRLGQRKETDSTFPGKKIIHHLIRHNGQKFMLSWVVFSQAIFTLIRYLRVSFLLHRRMNFDVY